MAQDAAKAPARGFIWEARKLLRAARVGTLATFRGRAAFRQPGHAGLRPGPVAAAAAVRSVRAYQAPARRCTLLGAGLRRGRRTPIRRPRRASPSPGWPNRWPSGAEIALSRRAPVRGAVRGLRRFLAVAHPAAGWPVCRRLRPRCPAPRRRPDAGCRFRRGHRIGGVPDHVALQHRPSRRVGGHRRRQPDRGGWSLSMSTAVIWPMGNGSIRIHWSAPVADPADVRRELVRLAAEARAGAGAG